MTPKTTQMFALLLCCGLALPAGAATFTVISTNGARLRSSPYNYSHQNEDLSEVVGGLAYNATVDVVQTKRINGQTWSQLSDGRWINSHLLRDSSGRMPAPQSVASVPMPSPRPRASVRSAKKTSKAPKSKVAKKDSKNDKKKTAKKDASNGCTTNFASAEKMFSATQGPDVHLASLGSFNGSIKSYQSSQRIFASGKNLYVRMNIANFIEVDVPAKICKSGSKLTAELLTSKATNSGTRDANPMLAQALASGDIPAVLSINISRSRNQLVFSGHDPKSGVPFNATAAVR